MKIELLMKQATRLNLELKNLSGDAYYEKQESLRVILREIESCDFVSLSKSKLIEFLSMCSSHRPIPPHSLLTRLSILNENRDTQ